MATFLKPPSFRAPLPLLPRISPSISLKSPEPFCISVRSRKQGSANNGGFVRTSSLRLARRHSFRFVKLVPFASGGGETETTETQEEVHESEIQDSSDGTGGVEGSSGADEVSNVEEMTSSVVLMSLQSYKEALASNDESRIEEIELFLKSIEDEKVNLERKVASLSDELSAEKERILRISADFDNFRKRTERERLSLVTNAQGEVVEKLLLVLDNFERAKTQIKVDSEGEEKINNSYQSIYKQFLEILGSLGVLPVETIGRPFNPLLHEAIMREDSEEFEEGIILDEYRKGYILGERLLRPSMVKVSAGPGPAKPEQVEPSEADISQGETSESKETSEDEVEAGSSS